MPASNVTLRCRCGTVRGHATGIDPTRGNRLVCMCDDCQTYARWLDLTPPMLDASGGTEVLQTTPSRVVIDEGRDQLRCVRLSPKGLMRWYAGCCRSPIANSLESPRAPFLGVAIEFIDVPEADRDQVIGPVAARIQGRHGIPPLPPNSYDRAPVGLILRSLGRIAAGLVRGAHKPSTLREPDGTPIVTPTVLTREVRDQCRPPHVTRPAADAV